MEILPLRKSTLVLQCNKCQAYKHTQLYSKEPRCVRCTGKHLTVKCDRPKNAQPKRIYCGEGYPANYKGCIIAKKMQNIKNKYTKNSVLPKQSQRTPQETVTNGNQGKKTYTLFNHHV